MFRRFKQHSSGNRSSAQSSSSFILLVTSRRCSGSPSKVGGALFHCISRLSHPFSRNLSFILWNTSKYSVCNRAGCGTRLNALYIWHAHLRTREVCLTQCMRSKKKIRRPSIPFSAPVRPIAASKKATLTNNVAGPTIRRENMVCALTLPNAKRRACIAPRRVMGSHVVY